MHSQASKVSAVVVAEQLPNELAGRQVGDTVVRRARVETREDSSERPALSIILVLDPPTDGDTWPVEDLWELKEAVAEAKRLVEQRFRKEHNTEPSDLPWFVEFESTRDELLDWEDIDGSLDSSD
jgi:hypothetical protein